MTDRILLATAFLLCATSALANGVDRQRSECDQFARSTRYVEGEVALAAASVASLVGFGAVISRPLPDPLPMKHGGGQMLQAYGPANGQYVSATEVSRRTLARQVVLGTRLMGGAVGLALTATTVVCSSGDATRYAGAVRDLLTNVLP
jgi:hypothetical protein